MRLPVKFGHFLNDFLGVSEKSGGLLPPNMTVVTGEPRSQISGKSRRSMYSESNVTCDRCVLNKNLF